MRFRLSDILKSLLVTVVVLVLMEIFSSTIMPILGLGGLRLAFNVILVLYLALRVSSVYLPYCILVLQLIHGFFSIEGWAMGTIAGVIISMFINYMKDLLHFSSGIITMVIVQLSQLSWFIIIGILSAIKLDDFSVIASMLWRFLPQSIILSLLSPLIFQLMDKIWQSGPARAGDGLGA
jgi:hypothetical protein